MKLLRFNPVLFALIAAALAFPSFARAADVGSLLNNQREADNFKIIHTSDLAALRADRNSKVQIFDADGDKTRDRFGVIPGAHLLSSPDKYDLSELPADKNAKLVFYCADLH